MNKTNHYRGVENPQYKYGAGVFVRKRAEIKERIGKCERCGKDLTNAGHYEWCVHHKNHNHYDNSEGNYELLCKKCHQLEHQRNMRRYRSFEQIKAYILQNKV